MDLVIAVVVFGFIAVVFYSLVALREQPSVDELQSRAQTIESRLQNTVGSCGAIVANQTTDLTTLGCLYTKNSTLLREELSISGKFCIYVEDSEGKILIIQNSSGSRWTSVGDDALIVSGTPCGTVSS
jgi:hypothetical protein